MIRLWTVFIVEVRSVYCRYNFFCVMVCVCVCLDERDRRGVSDLHSGAAGADRCIQGEEQEGVN